MGTRRAISTTIIGLAERGDWREGFPAVIPQVTDIALTIMIELRGIFTVVWVQLGTAVFPGERTWVGVVERKREMGWERTWKIILLGTVMGVGLRLGTLTRIATESEHVKRVEYNLETG